jgi:threonine/homoserine/homoserine lactone efflux protein
MLLDPTLTAAYAVLAAALALSPGPDVMFVLANGMRYRAKGAVSAALGIGTGSLAHATAAAVGISAIVAAAPFAFDAMRVVGAFYLAWLGLQAIRAFMAGSASALSLAAVRDISVGRIFMRGFLTNILNPKVIVFYLALLPQFVNVGLGHVGLQIFLLGGIHNVFGLTVLMVVGLIAGNAATWIARSGIGRWLDGIAGLFFLGLAIRLAFTGRPNP